MSFGKHPRTTCPNWAKTQMRIAFYQKPRHGIGCFMFFFFKQKTAYEILRSDWSSDVCSSDLLCDRLQNGRSHQPEHDERREADDDHGCDPPHWPGNLRSAAAAPSSCRNARITMIT